ncbi:carbohydrate kinase family protein [Dongia rigui]|uniref:Carbohydrate kinase family protein n=1 Tax=Dongia rigui TaxID=940149 RepID=A0ABU5E0W5_9PROT|nr:carbohydrate kinase family protein [Dongia rigui]MDY0873239.1 carbohydrate kinase family protein [Dongia rigui]
MRRPLIVIGNVNVDIIVGPCQPWPQPGTEALVDHGEVRVGGAAGNVALAWDALSVPYQIAANTGEDHFGHWLRATFHAHAGRWPVAKTPTTFSVGVTHPDGERTFFTIPGHMPVLTTDQVMGMIDIALAKGGIALLVGSYLTDALTADYRTLISWLHSHDIAVALDTGWPIAGWTPQIVDTTRGWLNGCDHLLLNEVEATALTHTSSVAAAIDALAALMPAEAHIVVKCGPAGAVGLHRGERVTLPAPKVIPVDTIGAGDVFDAAYLAEIAVGSAFSDAIAAGIRTASRAVATLPRQYL